LDARKAAVVLKATIGLKAATGLEAAPGLKATPGPEAASREAFLKAAPRRGLGKGGAQLFFLDLLTMVFWSKPLNSKLNNCLPYRVRTN